MACIEMAHKEILKIMKDNGYDMRTSAAKEVFLLADKMLNNIDTVVPDTEIAKKAQEIVYRIRKSPDRNVEPVPYWDNTIRNFINGGNVTIRRPDGGAFTGTVESSVLADNGTLAVSIRTGNNKVYGYDIDPNNGRAEDGTVIDELRNVYSLMNNEYGSRSNIEIEDARYDLLENNLNNDIRKARNLVNELDQYDKVAITPEHKQHLNEVLEMFVDETKAYIPDMKVYLDRRAEENGGKLRFNRKRGEIYLNAGQRDQQFAHDPSMREIFTHEIIHSAVEFGREYNRSAVSGTMARVRRLHKQFLKSFKAEDLVPEGTQYDLEAEKQNAQELYDYMSSENGIAEFIAHGLTNEQVVKKLRELNYYEVDTKTEANMFESLVQFFQELMNTVFARFRGEEGQRGDELLLKLSLELAESNNKATERLKSRVIDRVFESIEVGNTVTKAFIDKGLEIMASKADEIVTPGSDATRRDKFLFVAKNLGRIAFDKRFRPFLERFFSQVLNSNPEGTIQSFIRTMRTPDSTERIIEKMGRLSSTIDQQRKVEENSVINIVMQSFEKLPSKEQLQALGTVVAENDLSVLVDLGVERIGTIIGDDDALSVEIESAIGEFDGLGVDRANKRYYTNMAKKLGYYMATGKGDELTLLNARNIAKKLNDIEANRPAEVSDELVNVIDRLASLYGISYSTQESRNIVSNLIEEDSKGVSSVIAVQGGIKLASREVIDEDGIFSVKGYIKDVTDRKKDVRVGLLSEKNSLEEDGYNLVRELEGSNNDSTAGKFGLFVSDSFSIQPYNRTALRLGSQRKRGTSLRDAHYAVSSTRGAADAALDISKIRIANEVKVSSYFTTDIDPRASEGLVPLFNTDGEIVDYRYLMSKANKAKYLDRDSDVALALGKTSSNIYDKTSSTKFNSDLLDVIIAEMDKNFTGGKFGRDGREYVVIKPTSENADAREIYGLLPEDLKQEITDRLGDGQFVAVRRDQLYAYFGYRNISITDSTYGRKLLKNRMIRNKVRVAEEVWKEVVAISKVDIVIKTPAVLIGNVVSNFALSIQLGMNPIDVGKLQLEGVRELKDFRNLVKELAELETKQRSGLTSRAEDNRIKSIRRQMDQSPVKDLTDEGLFQSIIEDVTPDQTTASSRIESKINEVLSDKNKFIRDGIGWAYLTERNPVFKTMLTATQYSDFVARYGLYQAYRARGVSKPRAINRVNDAFINYGIPDSKLLQYLNDIGLVMFTKYFLRIQRVIRDGLNERPMNFLLAFLGQEYLLGDIEDITDQSIFDKDLTNVVHTPFEHIKNLVLPSGYQLADVVVEKLI